MWPAPSSTWSVDCLLRAPAFRCYDTQQVTFSHQLVGWFCALIWGLPYLFQLCVNNCSISGSGDCSFCFKSSMLVALTFTTTNCIIKLIVITVDCYFCFGENTYLVLNLTECLSCFHAGSTQHCFLNIKLLPTTDQIQCARIKAINSVSFPLGESRLTEILNLPPSLILRYILRCWFLLKSLQILFVHQAKYLYNFIYNKLKSLCPIRSSAQPNYLLNSLFWLTIQEFENLSQGQSQLSVCFSNLKAVVAPCVLKQSKKQSINFQIRVAGQHSPHSTVQMLVRR